jgi:hypothetical protein
MARGTLALPVPGMALGHFGSSLFFVFVPVETWKLYFATRKVEGGVSYTKRKLFKHSPSK